METKQTQKKTDCLHNIIIESRKKIAVSGVEDVESFTKKEKVLYVASFVVSVVVLFWCILRLAGGSYNPFIYFRF